MSMDTSRRKGNLKERQEGTDDEGKGGKPGDGKGKSNYVQPQTSSTPAIQNQQQQQQQQQQEEEAHYSSAASSSGHGFFAFAETKPARVGVLTAAYEEQDYQRRTPRGGQNQRDEVARQNKEGSKRFPVWVRDLGTLSSGLQRRPAPVPRKVGLQPSEASWKPLAKGTSLFTYGYSEKTEIPSHSDRSEEIEASDEQKSAFSFHILHVRTD